MISCYTGTCGSGKTYHAVQKILEKLKRGGYAIGNIELNLAEKYAGHYRLARFFALWGLYAFLRLYRISEFLRYP